MTTERDTPFQNSARDLRRLIRALLVIALLWLFVAQSVVADDTRADLLNPAERA